MSHLLSRWDNLSTYSKLFSLFHLERTLQDSNVVLDKYIWWLLGLIMCHISLPLILQCIRRIYLDVLGHWGAYNDSGALQNSRRNWNKLRLLSNIKHHHLQWKHFFWVCAFISNIEYSFETVVRFYVQEGNTLGAFKSHYTTLNFTGTHLCMNHVHAHTVGTLAQL